MPVYDSKSLRRAILETLDYVRFSEILPSSLLKALRPEYGDLIENTLMVEVAYLEKKGYVETTKGTNYITGREVTKIVITPKGVDLKNNDITDVGVSRG